MTDENEETTNLTKEKQEISNPGQCCQQETRKHNKDSKSNQETPRICRTQEYHTKNQTRTSS